MKIHTRDGGSNVFLCTHGYTQQMKGMKTEPLHEKPKEKCEKNRLRKFYEMKIYVTWSTDIWTGAYRNCAFSKYSNLPRNDRCLYIHQAERSPGNSDLPFSCDFGDLETEVHRVQIGWLPLEDVVAPPGLVWLRERGTERRTTRVTGCDKYMIALLQKWKW